MSGLIPAFSCCFLLDFAVTGQKTSLLFLAQGVLELGLEFGSCVLGDKLLGLFLFSLLFEL